MPKRHDYITKEDMFMTIAHISAMRSKDPNTQVGAVIVSKDGRILSTGYNGMPNGCSDDEYPWERTGDSDFNTKYYWVVHSELNAILNYRGYKRDLEDATLYVTLFPCHECAKAIIQSGIKKVYYDSNKYADTMDNKATKRMFESAGVACEHYSIKGLSIMNNDHSNKVIKTTHLKYIRPFHSEDDGTVSGYRFCEACGAPYSAATADKYPEFSNPTICYSCGSFFKHEDPSL